MNKTLRYSLLSLLMLVCGMISAATYSYEFPSTIFKAAGTQTLNDVEWTLATDAGYFGFDASEYKKGQQFGSSKKAATYVTLSTKGIAGTITSIKVNTAGASGITATLDVTVGGKAFGEQYTLTMESKDAEFTGSAEGEIVLSYKNTSAKALYIKSIEITYGNGGDTPQPVEVAAPTFSLESGIYTSAQTLTLTPAEGTTVYYTLDGTAPTKESTKYTAPIAITTTTTVKAIAYDAAGNASKVVSETYTFPVACANIAAVKDLESGSLVALSLIDAQVVYVNVYTSGTEPNTKTNTEYYVRDASGAIDLYNTGLELALGKVVNGTAIFKYTVYNGLPELTSSNATNAEGLTITDGKEVVPTVITVADLVNEEHLCDLVVVKNVQFATKKSGTYTNSYVFDPSTSDSALVYNKFKVESFSVPTDSKNYDVVGILGCAKLSGNIVNELFPTKAAEESSATSISNVKANVEAKETIYNIAGQRVAKLQKGLNIVNGKKVLVK